MYLNAIYHFNFSLSCSKLGLVIKHFYYSDVGFRFLWTVNVSTAVWNTSVAERYYYKEFRVWSLNYFFHVYGNLIFSNFRISLLIYKSQKLDVMINFITHNNSINWKQTITINESHFMITHSRRCLWRPIFCESRKKKISKF